MNTLIKAIIISKYEVALYETPRHTYIIQHIDKAGREVTGSPISDLKLALFMFDALLQELEGQ